MELAKRNRGLGIILLVLLRPSCKNVFEVGADGMEASRVFRVHLEGKGGWGGPARRTLDSGRIGDLRLINGSREGRGWDLYGQDADVVDITYEENCQRHGYCPRWNRESSPSTTFCATYR